MTITDEQLKETIRTDPRNGEYATDICRKCGNFRTLPTGNVQMATFHDGCPSCRPGRFWEKDEAEAAHHGLTGE